MISSEMREYTIPDLDLFISDNNGFRILKKLIKNNIIDIEYTKSDKMFANLVSERNPFGITTTFNKFEKNEHGENVYKIYRSKNRQAYVNGKHITKGFNLIDTIKVITPFANNIGTDLADDNLNTKIIAKGEICTETYLVIGSELDLDISKATNISKYLITKFIRFLINLAKANQNGTRQTYRFVPLQDFANNSDIDWSKTIEEIDMQLYKKYDLSQDEIEFIEGKIKRMK